MLQGVKSPHPVDVVWEGGKRFRGGIPGEASIVVDGDREAGPSPVDSMLVALAACAGIDVVEILAKRRTPASDLRVHCEFFRAESAPRRLTAVDLTFSVATASARSHVEYAVRLAVEKYCSVASSLAPDTRITWTVELQPVAEAAG